MPRLCRGPYRAAQARWGGRAQEYAVADGGRGEGEGQDRVGLATKAAQNLGHCLFNPGWLTPVCRSLPARRQWCTPGILCLGFCLTSKPAVIDLPQMGADLSILQAALIGYQHQRDQIDAKMAEIRRELSGKTGGVKPTTPTAPGAPSTPLKRVVSPAARRRMAAGQRKRWAAVNAAKPAEPAKQPAPKKRKMSAAERKRIIEATKKRWAEFRAKKAAGK